MNELLYYLNNYTMKRRNRQRFSALILCLAVIVSFAVSVGLIEPAESASGELICGMEEHEHTQDCFELICGFDEETEEEISVDAADSDSEETAETTVSTEGTTTSTENVETVPVHMHSDECYRLICLTEAHLHKQDCYNQPVETAPVTTEISTSASTSTGTDTTAATEQTAETSTTTTELSEEIYELNAALFGELYKDRVSVLADAKTITKGGVRYTYYEIEDVKFYYDNTNLYYNKDCFAFLTDLDNHPACNVTTNVSVGYNGTTRKGVYNFDGTKNGRYISFEAPEDGTLIYVFSLINDGEEFKMQVTTDSGVVADKDFKKTTSNELIITVKKGEIYTIKQPSGNVTARIGYIDFIPNIKIEEYKFYYDDEKILHYNECFSYPDGTDGPNANTVTPNLEVVYNGNTYTNTYNFNKTDARYITLKAPKDGTLFMAFDGGTYNINVKNTSTNEVKKYSCNNSDQNVIAVPVAAGGEYKIYQNANDNYKARLAYAEFVPTFTKEEIAANLDKTYRIRNVKTGLYLEVEKANPDNNTKIKIGQYSYNDNRNDFKFVDAGNGNFNIKTLLNDSYMLDYDGTNIKTYSTDTGAQQNRWFKFNINDDGTYKINTYKRIGGDVSKLYIDQTDNNYVKASNAAIGDDFIFVEKVVTIDTNRTYAIQNYGSKKFLSYGDADITQVDSGEYSESDNNLKFKFEDAGDGYYYIKVLAKGIETNYLEAYYNNDSKDLKIAAKDESNNNQKFKIIDNLDGTYKIRCEGGALDANPNLGVSTYYDSPSNQNQKFIIAETEPPTVGSPAVISPDTTFLIRNVRSRLYIHREENAPVYQKNSDGDIAYDNNNKPIVESYLTNQAIQHEDKDYIEEETQFKFVSTGKQGEYYIKSVNGDVALSMDNIANGAANIKYEAFNENDDNQKFRAEILDNGSYCFYRIVDGVRYYVGIPYTSVMDGMIIDARPSENVSDNLTFFLVPFVENPNVEESRTRVEARVIFADYNDGKFDLYKYADDKVKNGEKKAGDVKTDERNLYDEPAYRPVLELNGYPPVNANYVVDVSDARKDWCYQYNYVWDLDSGTTNTVKLNGVNNDHQITLNGKVFNVYYLKDTELGHPGNNGESNAPIAAYKQTPYSLTGDQIIYIFLDPVVEKWWPNGEKPDTFDLSMKKRWDGYNEGYGFRNRPKEKIKIQLQHLVNGKWVRFDSDEYMNEYYYEVTDDKGNRHMVNIDKIDQIDTKFVYYKKGEYYTDENCTTKWNKVTYDDLKGTADALDPKKEKRLIVKMVSSEDWNDIVLTVGGENNPQHFTNGYYYNWKGLPYGNYRVVETQSFYDANDNNVLDPGDRDTSQEYYYMSYPPMRDSKGVLHIQNFTKDMVIEVQKKWQDDEGGDMMLNKPIEFEVYRCLGDPRNSVPENPDLVGKFTTNENGYAFITSRAYDSNFDENSQGNGYYYGVHDMETKNGDTKYHYFIKEIVPDGYKLINGNEDGYVWRAGIDADSEPKDYAIDYEDGDSRKFIITNKAKIGLRVEKEWYNTSVSDENKIDYYNNNTDNPIYPKFKIYKGDRPGTPVVNDNICSVNGVALEKIADVTIGKDGYFELVSDENDKHGDSSYVNDELNMLSDTKYELVSTGFDGNIFRNASDHPANIQGDYIVVDNTNRFWVGSNKTKNNQVKAPYITGTLTLEFENYDENSILSVGNRCTINGNESNEAKYYNIKDANGVVSIPGLYVDGNYRIMGYNCTLNIKKVTFTHDAYYYIQEITNDNSNYTLSNGDDNGFVEVSENVYYTTITANNRYPVVTAQNIPKVNLDITKEWTQSNANISKAMNFEIYKAFANGEPVADDNGYKVTVNDADYQLTKLSSEYKTDENGNLNVADLAAFEKGSDGKYHKLYYYVREVDGNYTITNTNAKNGFIPYEDNLYGTAYDDTSSNSGKYKFTNTPKLDLTVNKIWKDANGEPYNAMVSTEIKFKVYRKIENGEFMPVPENGSDYVTSGLKKVIEGLDAYDENGNIYTYYIKEIDGETYFLSGFNVKYNNKTNPEECAFSWKKYGEKPVINVTNQAKPQNYELPVTGGSGTHGCTAAGGAIVLLSAAVLLLKRRKKMV